VSAAVTIHGASASLPPSSSARLEIGAFGRSELKDTRHVQGGGERQNPSADRAAGKRLLGWMHRVSLCHGRASRRARRSNGLPQRALDSRRKARRGDDRAVWLRVTRTRSSDHSDRTDPNRFRKLLESGRPQRRRRCGLLHPSGMHVPEELPRCLSGGGSRPRFLGRRAAASRSRHWSVRP
jgi:hypothetical protein